MIDDTTICAVSTASGVGGIAVLRISGKEAFDIVDKIFVPLGRKASLREQNPYTVSYGKIVDDDNSIVDNVLVTVFKEPHSFTGENVVEIACHGSTYIQQAILRLLVDNGCVLATPGEFTKSFRRRENGFVASRSRCRPHCLYFESESSDGDTADERRFLG